MQPLMDQRRSTMRVGLSIGSIASGANQQYEKGIANAKWDLEGGGGGGGLLAY